MLIFYKIKLINALKLEDNGWEFEVLGGDKSLYSAESIEITEYECEDVDLSSVIIQVNDKSFHIEF